jgi:hypothetical protein
MALQFRLQDVLTGRWSIPPEVRLRPYSTDTSELETVLTSLERQIAAGVKAPPASDQAGLSVDHR